MMAFLRTARGDQRVDEIAEQGERHDRRQAVVE